MRVADSQDKLHLCWTFTILHGRPIVTTLPWCCVWRCVDGGVSYSSVILSTIIDCYHRLFTAYDRSGRYFQIIYIRPVKTRSLCAAQDNFTGLNPCLTAFNTSLYVMWCQLRQTNDQWWNKTKYMYSSTVYVSPCYTTYLLTLNNISEGDFVLFTPLHLCNSYSYFAN